MTINRVYFIRFIKFWNLEQTGFVNFHVTSMNAGSCLLENAPAAQLCSSEYVEPEPEAPTVGLTCVPIDVTVSDVEYCHPFET